MEEKVYPCWAFSDNELEKRDINYKIYQEIKDKAKIELTNIGRGFHKYRAVNNPENLTDDELALIADSGNLCFGYHKTGESIKIWTD